MIDPGDFAVIRWTSDRENNTGRLAYIGSEAQTLAEALEISIAKWKAIVRVLESPDDKEPINFLFDGGESTCALCRWHGDYGEYCRTCMIGQLTGLDTCMGTPYEDYFGAPYDAHEERGPMTDDTRLPALEAARAEVAFLQSLRKERD